MNCNALFFVCTCLLFNCNCIADTFLLTYVYDGDTVKLRDHAGEFKLRLSDIDAPERAQAYGKKSRRALMQLCKGPNITVTAQLTGMDQYQRYLGRLQCNHIDASLYLTQQGLAWHNTKYSSDRNIFNAQQQARQHKIGLWQDAKAIAPWIWRKQHGVWKKQQGAWH